MDRFIDLDDPPHPIWQRDPSLAIIISQCPKCLIETVVVEVRGEDHRLICLHCGLITKQF